MTQEDRFILTFDPLLRGQTRRVPRAPVSHLGVLTLPFFSFVLVPPAPFTPPLSPFNP
jgi:hypothetical protein